MITYGQTNHIRMSRATFDTMQFLSGKTLLSRDEFLQMYGGALGAPKQSVSEGGKRTLTAGPLGGEVKGTAVGEILIGGPGTDVLIGGGGNDEFRPGKPAGAQAIGGAGNDVYLFNRDDGRLMIRDEGGSDEIRFGAGITPADVRLHSGSGTLTLLVTGSAQADSKVKPRDQWSIMIVDEPMAIERITFSEGTIWNQPEIQRRLDTK